MHKVYLSKRNILTLLSKLNRSKFGEVTACTIIKGDNKHKEYPQTARSIVVTAVETVSEEVPRLVEMNKDLLHLRIDRSTLEKMLDALMVPLPVFCIPESKNNLELNAVQDEVYYADRTPGEVHPADDPV